ncbi:alpha/beta hydrolase [Amycolatopsis sp. CA-230715]|uniref:alpha/beta hydrolase n=1 Tax=Amycolatopsis sp. CA-230715 TaxID=2745196 RepID=UPI001C03462D|nr:alpha/beta hydrolase [Amycolatopsis sp. CA-230715]QWF78817.1 hypothetical protein HUW46_02215 [Amycolatopsis sp. CA-230715]
MVSLADVKNWKPEVLNEIATTLRQRQQTLVHSGDDFGRLMPMASWTGPAADAAQGTHNRLMTRLMALTAVTSAVSKGLMQASDAIPPVKHAIEAAEELARKYGFTVDANGQVTDDFAGKEPPPEMHPEDRAHVHEQVGADLTQALRTAEDIDNDLDSLFFRAAFGEYADFHQGTVAAAADAGLKEIGLTLPEPPPGATPAQNAAWWATLSKVGQTIYARDNPGIVGKLDGVPVAVRDEANQRVLVRQKESLQKQCDDVQKKIDGLRRTAGGEIVLNDQSEYEDLKSQIDDINGKLGGIKSIEDRLQNAVNGQKAYLLGVNTENAGQAIVSSGNPDEAENVATFVPGTGAKLAEVGDQVARSDLMLRSAQDAGSPSTAVVTWIGYDAPQNIILDSPRSVFADNAERPLHDFQAGLLASHPNDPSHTPPHTTVIGHSYGTTAIGQTARDHGLAADDLVFAGSPGVGVRHADQLHLDNVPPDQVGKHVFSTAAPTDPIPILTNFHTENTDDIDPLGPDPTMPWFGGQSFDADASSPFHSHSDYWEPRSSSLRRMGQVIAGN